MSNEYKDWLRDEEFENKPKNASYWKRRCKKAEAAAMQLREALKDILVVSLRSHESDYTKVRHAITMCEQAIDATPKTAKLAAVLDAAIEWQGGCDGNCSEPLCKAVRELRKGE
jgi:hypothetical protein